MNSAQRMALTISVVALAAITLIPPMKYVDAGWSGHAAAFGVSTERYELVFLPVWRSGDTVVRELIPYQELGRPGSAMGVGTASIWPALWGALLALVLIATGTAYVLAGRNKGR